MKQQWQNNNAKEEDDEVTLINHSDKSAFKKFRPLLASTIIRANYHPINIGYIDRGNSEDSESSENYLTSEKTHFNPLMADGHTFVIEHDMEEVEWERSPSGGLLWNNKKYKTWNGGNKNADDIDLVAIENETSDFTVKYKLRETDKACQTDESEFISKSRSFMEINEEYCKRKIYDEYFKETSSKENNKWRYMNNNDDSNDYSLFSVNRVKSNNNNNSININNHTINNNSNNLTSQNFHDILLSSNSSSSSICTITSSYEPSAVDPFESWRNLKVENNNNSILDSNTCMHRLWEQCLVCARNNEDPYADKPLPANRLMKDELQLDGDEIMNVIQNLYITGDYCEEDEEKEDDCEEFDMNHVYMNMIMDDSMDGTCTLEDESKFYEPSIDVKNQKNMIDLHQLHHRKDLLNLESYDEITLTKMQWQWNKDQEKDKDHHEKYLKLLNWLKTSLVKSSNSNNTAADTNNNDCQDISEVHLSRNRKRRHSTCQNLLEKKRYDEGFTYHLNLENSSLTPSFLEDSTNLFFDAAKMFKINIEKIMLITDPCIESTALESYKEIGGANYYRNIMQQQHALIKQLDLSRPLTR